MRPTIIYLFAATLPALSVVAQRHGGGGGGGFFGNHGGGGFPNTFITVASAAPAAATPPATQPAGSAPAPAAAPPATGGTTPDATTGFDASLIPPYGITACISTNDGTANCVGDNGKAIPCSCPPPLSQFSGDVAASVAAGMAFPSGTSAADQLARLQTCIVTLQNFVGGPGSGVGCPIVSTTWKELQTQLQSEV